MRRFGFFPRTKLDRFSPEYSKQTTKRLAGQLPKRVRNTQMLESNRKNRLANKEFIYNQNPTFKTDPLLYSLLKNSAKSGNPNYLDAYRGASYRAMTNTDKRNMYKWKNSKEFKEMEDTWNRRQADDKKDTSNDLDVVNISYNKRWGRWNPKSSNETNEVEKKKTTYTLQAKERQKTSDDDEEEESTRKAFICKTWFSDKIIYNVR